MSASRLSQSPRLSSTLKMEEEAMVTKNQGIVSILESDGERSNKASASSLRRTLSADMSPTKWLTQHGVSLMKKIASSEEFSINSITDSSSSEGEDGYEDERKDGETEREGQFDLWSSIQEEVYKKKELEKPGSFDIWSSIISQKAQESSDKSLQSTPYIHPLVKKSASSLSKKSLEICTESLGSETGSDGFSSCQSSESGDADDDKEMEQEIQSVQQTHELPERVEQSFYVDHHQEVRVPKYNYVAGKKSPQRTFPPPIPSLSRSDGASIRMQSRCDNGRLVLEAASVHHQEVRVPKYNYVAGKKSPQRSFPPPIPSLSRSDGASIRMQSRRDNGRLVLEAVSVPSTKNFLAERQDGRLVLSFVNSFPTEKVASNEDEDKVEEVFEEEEEEEEEVEESDNDKESRVEMEIEFVMEEAPKKSSPVINMHRLILVMNKHMGLPNRDPTWPKKFNEVVKFDEVEDNIKPETILAQPLPSPPRMARLIPTPTVAATAKVTTPSGALFNSYEYFWRAKPMSSGAVLKPMNQPPQNNPAGNNSKLILSNNNSLLKNEQQQQQLLVFSGQKGDYLVPLSKGCKKPKRSLDFWESYCIATS